MPGSEGVYAGIISKPHGLRGDVILISDPGIAKLLQEGIPLFIDLDRQRIPFFIEELTVVAGDQFIIKFEFINSVEEARNVSGCRVYIVSKEALRIMQDRLNFKDLVGYTAFGPEGEELGSVREYIREDPNPMLILENQGKELFIPAVPEFIQKTDHAGKKVWLELPEGLTDL